MKIYNKKKFGSGMVSIVLGLLNILAGIRSGFDIKDVILITTLLSIGGAITTRSFSHELAREDKLEELDERNQLVKLKTKSKSFQLTQGICFGLMIALFVMGGISGQVIFINIAVGLAFAFTISMFTELFTYYYYEKHL